MTLRKLSVVSTGLTTSVTAYTSGDVVGNRFGFAGITDSPETFIKVVGCNILDNAAVMGACELWFFNSSVTFGTDNNPISISDAELKVQFLGKLIFGATDVSLGSLNGVITYSGKDVILKPFISTAPADLGNYVNAQLVTKTANSFFGAVGDIQIDLTVESGLKVGN